MSSEEKKYSFTSLEIFKNLYIFSKAEMDKIPLLSRDLMLKEISEISERGIVPFLKIKERGSKGMNDVAADFVARGVLDDEVSSLTALCPCFYAVINIAVGVAGENYGLFPARDIGCDAFDKYGCAEDCAVEYAADGAVGRLPHLF